MADEGLAGARHKPRRFWLGHRPPEAYPEGADTCEDDMEDGYKQLPSDRDSPARHCSKDQDGKENYRNTCPAKHHQEDIEHAVAE